MSSQDFIDLQWRDLFATPVDDLFEPTGESQIPVRINDSLIARAKPAVAKGLRIRIGVVLITCRDARPPMLPGGKCRPVSSMIEISTPVGMPTVPGLRTRSGNGLLAI